MLTLAGAEKLFGGLSKSYCIQALLFGSEYHRKLLKAVGHLAGHHAREAAGEFLCDIMLNTVDSSSKLAYCNC